MKKDLKKYRVRDACFACTTPYQVIGSIGIVMDKKYDADLYIYGLFPGFEAVAEKLRKYGIFSNIYTADGRRFGAPGMAKGLSQMVFAQRTAGLYAPADTAYRAFFSSSRALPKRILQRALLKRNPDMKKVYFDDGLGTYNSTSHTLNASKLLRRTERLLGWELDRPDRTSMIAYVPELVELPPSLCGIRVGQMPRLSFDRETALMLDDVFSVGEDSRIRERFILFDPLRSSFGDFDAGQLERLDRYYEAVRECAGPENIICKSHPRSTENTASGIALYSGQQIPVEILYAQMEDLGGKVLITFTSTAVFTPKILFDREPYVICLHRLFKDIEVGAKFDTVFDKFKSIYTDQSRVMAPSSMEELRAMVSGVK